MSSLPHQTGSQSLKCVLISTRDRPLQIKQLVNGAYPDTAFTARCSVADIWVDSGRREREGFDQHGIVRVIPVPSSSTSTPTLRHQRAASVFQDVEGAAKEAKRKFSASGISANDSLARPGATTPPQNKEQTDPQHHQSKRPKLTAETDPQSPSPRERFHTTSSSPVYYNGGRVPSFALPRGHRRHLTNTSPGSPEIGLGLGITASPARDKIARDKLTADGIQKPSSMPPPPLPRHSLRGPTNSSPLEGSSQDDSPLGTRKPAERPHSSVPRETSRNNDKRPRTRAALKASGSGTRSHHARASSDPNATPKPKLTPDYYLEKDRTELKEVRKLLKDRKTNPECLPILRDMSDLHKEMIDLKTRLGLTATERKRLINIARKRLGRRRNRLEKFKNNGQLCDESDAHTITSDGGNAGDGPDEGAHESSDEDLLKKNLKRPRIEKRDLSADFVAARRISSLRAYPTGVKIGDSPQSPKEKEPDGQGFQVLIGDTGAEQASPSARASSARASRSNSVLPGGVATEGNENEAEENMTESEGEDIQFEAEAPQVEHSSPIRKSTGSKRASPRNAPPLGAEPGVEENGFKGVYSTAK